MPDPQHVGALPRPPIAVRLERGRTTLVLSRPTRVALPRAGLTVTDLELDLGTIPRGTRLHEGWLGLQSIQSTVRRGRFELEGLATSLGLVVDGATREHVHVTHRAAASQVACDLTLRLRGNDLLIAVGRARGGLLRGGEAWVEVARLIREHGARLDESLGAFVVDGFVRQVLLEVAATWGIRVPSVDLSRASIDVAARDTVVLTFGAAPPEDTFTGPALLASVHSPLFAGDVELAHERFRRAGNTWPEAVRREAAATLAQAGAAVAVETPTSWWEALAALDAASPDLDAVRAWARTDPSPRFAVDRLVAMAEACADPAVREGLMVLAIERRAELPADTDDVPLERALLTWLSLPLALAEAIRSAEERIPSDLAHALSAEALGDAERAWSRWERCRDTDDGLVLAHLAAAVEARLGPGLTALEAWDRASAASSSVRARALAAAARVACSVGLSELAATRLEAARGLRIPIESAMLLLQAAKTRALTALATAIEQLVLDAVQLDPESPFAPAAIEEALTWALDRGALDRARVLRTSLARLRPDTAQLYTLPEPLPGKSASPRATADALRSEGRLEEAAQLLHAVGREERDAATLRAALDLAERAQSRTTALAILATLLDAVPEGPVRDSLERRRARWDI